MSMKLKIPVVIGSLLLAAVSPVALGADYYFDDDLPAFTDWSAANAWSTVGYDGPFDTTWSDGNMANFDLTSFSGVVYNINVGSGTIAFGPSGGIRLEGSKMLRVNGPGTLNLDGSTIYLSANSAPLTIYAPIVGDFTVSGGSSSRNLLIATNTLYSGTITLAADTGASLSFSSNAANTMSPTSRIIVNQGTSLHLYEGDYALGIVEINSGLFQWGPASSRTGSAELTLSGLAGTGGTSATFDIHSNTSAAGQPRHLNIDQAIDTVFNGRFILRPVSGNQHIASFTKRGAGTLELANLVQAYGGTRIEGGTLRFSGGVSKVFKNDLGGDAAITVANGGTLSGSSTLQIQNGKDVVVQVGGALDPWGNNADGIGRLTLDFQDTGGNYGVLDLTAAAGSGGGWLKFTLGSDATAGTTYDQIRVQSGDVLIGDGNLKFSDFSFVTVEGFDDGIYTLFDLTDGAQLIGSLSSNNYGYIGSGRYGLVSISGNNLILTVAIPEPAGTSLVVLLVGIGAAIFFGRRRSRRS